MIIANIIGGLGNQMFQYAAAKALSLRHGWPLKLYAGEFKNYNLHGGFELPRLFPLEEQVATPAEVRAWLGIQASPFAQKLIAKLRLPGLLNKRLVIEPHYEFWPGIDSIQGDAFLRGYWHSPRYFEDYAAEIRKLFSFVPPLDSVSERLAAQMQSEESVSLHIRRGDYLSWRNRRIQGSCPLAYYTRSAEYLLQRFPDLRFYIFSDDPAWVSENLSPLLSRVTLINHNRGADSYRDMQLMSCARHNVIANSSFSWWGAWLNAHPEKIVIAPEAWFANGQSAKDLIPADWIRL